MIGHLLVTLMLILSVILSGMSPFAALPLILVPLSAVLRSRWVGLIGLLAFCTVGLGTLKGTDLTDLTRFFVLTVSLVLPCALLLELVLSAGSDRPQRVSLWPILVVSGLIATLAAALVLLTRFQSVGVYLGSDPTLQVFVLMSLSILFTGPILLTTGPKGPLGGEKRGQTARDGQRTNKNE